MLLHTGRLGGCETGLLTKADDGNFCIRKCSTRLLAGGSGDCHAVWWLRRCSSALRPMIAVPLTLIDPSSLRPSSPHPPICLRSFRGREGDLHPPYVIHTRPRVEVMDNGALGTSLIVTRGVSEQCTVRYRRTTDSPSITISRRRACGPSIIIGFNLVHLTFFALLSPPPSI